MFRSLGLKVVYLGTTSLSGFQFYKKLKSQFPDLFKFSAKTVTVLPVTATILFRQHYPHPDDHTTRPTITPGFKPFTVITGGVCNLTPKVIVSLKVIFIIV